MLLSRDSYVDYNLFFSQQKFTFYNQIWFLLKCAIT